MKVWLDDVREAPHGWVHVRMPEEAIDLLRGGEVEEISLDHDLGLDVGRNERTGYDVLLWLEAEVAAVGLRPPSTIEVHSGNVGAIKRMEQHLMIGEGHFVLHRDHLPARLDGRVVLAACNQRTVCYLNKKLAQLCH